MLESRWPPIVAMALFLALNVVARISLPHEGLVRVDGVPTQDVDAQWLSRTALPRPTTFRLGWESYGGARDTLWFDDVAIGSSRIGC